MTRPRVVLLAAAALALSPSVAGARERAGRFVVLSDIHAYAAQDGGPAVDVRPATCPESGATCPSCDPNAADTQAPLVESLLQDLACQQREGVDFVIVTGDWIAHYYQDPGESAQKQQIMTTLTGLLRAQFGPDTLLVPVLGNNDAYEGDYNVQPRSRFLSDMSALWAPLFPASAHLGTCLDDRPPGDAFERSFTSGGYYAFANPSLPNNCTLVLNTTLMTANYIFDWRTNGPAAAAAQMSWLGERLAEARAARPPKDVWLLYHVPPGADPFASASRKSATMTLTDGTLPASAPAPDFATAFVDLMVAYRDVIKASFAGHSHDDEFRVISDEGGRPAAWVHLTPSVTPDHHSGRSAYQVFSYATTGGRAVLTDFETRHLVVPASPLPGPPAWRAEYSWKKTFCHSACVYDAIALDRVSRALALPEEPYAARYRRFYGERGRYASPAIADSDWRFNLCAIAEARKADYAACALVP